MKKIKILLVVLTISLFVFGQNDSIQMDSTVNVYVYGQITDGIDRELVYWKNGTLCHIPNSKPLTKEESAGLEIENGDIYSYRYRYKGNRIDTISVYKNGKKLYSYEGYNGYYKESYSSVSSMAVLNGNVYLGLEIVRDYDRKLPPCCLIKNDKIDQRQIEYGKYISVENGLLCYSIDGSYYNGARYEHTSKGYVIGGQNFTFDWKLCDKYIFEGMRVSHKNVFFGVYDKNNSSKMMFIQRNINDSIPLPANIESAKDFAYIISRYIFAICYSTDYKRSNPFVANVITGNTIELPFEDFKPIRLVSYGRCLYILCYEQTGALKYYYLCKYDMSKSNMTYYNLPNCSSAWDIHVEKK